MDRTLAVLTSGGDAPGMNAAIRAIVRRALDRGQKVYGVYNGYEGLVEGGDAIRLLEWKDVGGILQAGGTFLGTARSERFKDRDGRQRAVLHLLQNGIEALMVIGGDGSLTGLSMSSGYANSIPNWRWIKLPPHPCRSSDFPAPSTMTCTGPTCPLGPIPPSTISCAPWTISVPPRLPTNGPLLWRPWAATAVISR